MIIKHLEVEGVCPLDERSLDLLPGGINVLLGPNESGKSTLAEAVIAVIFGINREIQLQPMPGAADRFRGVLELELEGIQYRIERHFDSDATRILRRSNGGEELLFEGDANPRGRTEEPALYRKILSDRLGLPSASVIKNSAFVGQLDISVDLDEELRKQISGAGQGDYKQAAERLQKQYYQLTAEGLPGEQARRKDREMETLEAELEALEQELDQAREISRSVNQRQEARVEFQEALDGSRTKRDRARREWQALDDFHNLVEQAESLYQQKRIQQKNQEQVSNLRKQIDSLEKELEKERYRILRDLDAEERSQLTKYVQSDAEEAWQELQGLKEERTALLEELEDPRYQAFSAADEHTGESLKGLLKARQALSGVREQLEALAPAQKAVPARLAWLVPILLSLLGFPAGYLLGRQILPGLAISLDLNTGSLIAGGVLAAAGLIIGLILLLLIRLNTHSPERRQIELESRREDLEGEVGRLRKSLESVYQPEKEVPLEVLIDRWEQWAALQQEVEPLEERISLLQKREIFRIRENPRLGEIIEEVGSQVLGERLASYQDLHGKQANLQETLETLTGAEEISSGDAAQLDRKLQEAILKIDALEEDYPSFKLLKEEEAQRLEKLAESKETSQRLEEEVENLQAQLHQSEKELAVKRAAETRDPVVIREEMEEKQQLLERLHRRSAALQTAYVVLGEAIREYEADHLTRLSEQTSALFQAFTDDRYLGVEISGEDPIRVQPAGGEPFGAELLSAGAVDQLYLALRIAVTDLLSSQVRLPFLFDDSFVNFDQRRLAAAREILEEIAQRRQVILLSHDPRYRSWGERVIELAAPG